VPHICCVMFHKKNLLCYISSSSQPVQHLGFLPFTFKLELPVCHLSRQQLFLKTIQLTIQIPAGADKGIRLLPMEDFISLFPRMPCHQKYFETVNETTPKMHDFILEFHNTKFYVAPSVVYEMKLNLLTLILV
jgi:hypothetical protein